MKDGIQLLCVMAVLLIEAAGTCSRLNSTHAINDNNNNNTHSPSFVQLKRAMYKYCIGGGVPVFRNMEHLHRVASKLAAVT